MCIRDRSIPKLKANSNLFKALLISPLQVSAIQSKASLSIFILSYEYSPSILSTALFNPFNISFLSIALNSNIELRLKIAFYITK